MSKRYFEYVDGKSDKFWEIGSDAALMALSGIAQKLKFRGLKAKANELMEAIAADLGLTKPELEDRVVPDYGLGAGGEREFDFGRRKFRFVLGPELKPMVRDEAGKRRADLPKPGARDDAAVAAQAVADWKLVKKQCREVGKVQAVRLEQAMVTGRRWTAAELDELIVRQPLLTHLARQLLWGVYGAGGELTGCFRLTDELDYAGVGDEPVALAADARVGLVHPLALAADARAAWGEQFSDYELIPPFPQLGRAVHALQPGEAKQDTLRRFKGVTLPAPTLVYGLGSSAGAAASPRTPAASTSTRSRTRAPA